LKIHAFLVAFLKVGVASASEATNHDFEALLVNLLLGVGGYSDERESEKSSLHCCRNVYD
jgi:hypothetical protein